MSILTVDASSTIAPIRQLLLSERQGALAVITAIQGPSYRPLGATMAVFDRREWTGTLSSGCVEADIALHAMKSINSGQPEIVTYGAGSPFADIQLPCGGGLEITIIPDPDKTVLSKIVAQVEARQVCALSINLTTGKLAILEDAATQRAGDEFTIRFEPELQFFVFGKGPEAATFAGLVHSAGYPNVLLSPDEETLTIGAAGGSATYHLTSAHFPDDFGVDQYSAIILFFHDHEWEPPILQSAFKTPAFYIGAQGSLKAAEDRKQALMQAGVSSAEISRLHGPIGLIPSVRDARKLAVSVLAEVLVASGF